MDSRFVERDAEALVARYADSGVNRDLALRIYTTRLLGQDPRLVLHGGGNTSVKTSVPDLLGQDTPVLCVKGTGWDMGVMEPPGMPAVRMEPLLKLRAHAAVSDEEMVRFQRASLIDPMAPGMDLTPFWEIVADAAVEKITHAGQQDLEPVIRHLNRPGQNVFDTQICAGFVGMAYPVSLSKLVKEVVGARLGKGLTFSHWDQRPLSAQQLKYAANDVRYLPAIRAELSVAMFSVLPGQPRTVAYSTVLVLLRVNRMSCAVPARGVVNEPPPICVGPSP